MMCEIGDWLKFSSVNWHCWGIKILTVRFYNCNSILFCAFRLSFKFYFRITLYHLWLFFSNTLTEVALDPVHYSWLKLFNVFQLNVFHWKMCLSLNLNFPQIYAFLMDSCRRQNLHSSVLSRRKKPHLSVLQEWKLNGSIIHSKRLFLLKLVNYISVEDGKKKRIYLLS